jgi:hypothetical protein
MRAGNNRQAISKQTTLNATNFYLPRTRCQRLVVDLGWKSSG